MLPKSSLPVIEELSYQYAHAIIGTGKRLKDIRNIIKQKSLSVIIIEHKELTQIISDNEQAEREKIIINMFKDVNSVLILSNNKGHSKKVISSDQNNYSDTSSLLIIEELNLLRNDNENGLEFNIVAEIEEHSSKEIFMASGANQVIPRRILLERVLAKMVFNHGKMYEFLMELVTLDNDSYLRTYKVKEGDDFAGENIKQLMLGNAKNYKVCGWLPDRHASELGKNTMGFGHHFITAFNSKSVDKIIHNSTDVEVDDILMILCFDNNHESVII